MSAALLPKPHGPFRLLGGNHEEDEGVAKVKVKRMEGGVIECEGGELLTLGREGAEVTMDGKPLRLYSTRGGSPRRITCGEVRPGHELILARKVKHTIASSAEKPFMSNVELDVLHNRERQPPKIVKVHAPDQSAELLIKVEEQARRIRELEEAAAARDDERNKAPADNKGQRKQ